MSRRLTALLFVAASICLRPAQGFAKATQATASSKKHSDVHSGTLNHKVGAGLERKSATQPAIRLAITVDDLPGGGPEVLGYTHVQMVKDVIATLQAHQVPHPAGFIVGEMLETDPSRNEAIVAWVQAGFLVGNHTYSHDRIGELGLHGFMDDIQKNRAVVDPLEQRLAQRQRYFRFPYLEEGTTHQEREALWTFLQAQRYTLVRASVTFSDTDWADAYLRCMQQAEKDSLDALDRSYLANAVGHLRWSVAAARAVLGRSIPLVLLLHVNVPTAKNLGALLQAYQAEGVQFVPLEEALREPEYTAHYDVPGGNLLGQASTSLGRSPPPELLDQDVLIDRVCR